ncbi:septal ring lytic transglycosylase RlpA family protein, partial [Acetobacter oeni]|uniref:septal ring lytic transglycosylase RlpA family protein n=1 Tax=Acetobacter oeni TaxID=304077 RepID=UPI00222FC80E
IRAGCHPTGPAVTPLPHVHYEVGAPWVANGVWHYPHQEFAYRETGLAVIDAPAQAPRLTADGELYDPMVMAGAHPTLQLPVMVSVRNMENGRTITIRLNDRGPANRGRLVSLTPQAAAALAIAHEPAQVEITELELPSRTYAETLPGGPLLDMQAAPVADVRQETLDSAGQRTAVPTASPSGGAGTTASSTPTALPALPVTVTQGWATPGSLWVEAGRFTERRYAALAATRAGGTVWHPSESNGPAWVVRVGPFTRAEDADAALDRALNDGLTGAQIIVE